MTREERVAIRGWLRHRRFHVVAVAAIIASVVVVAPPASVAGQVDADEVDDLEAPFFWDVNGDPNASWISAIVTAGFSDGCADPFEDFFCPADDLLREQAAAWLVRALDVPLAAESTFVDIDDSPFAREISAAHAAGIVNGCDDEGPSFCPTDSVTAREFGWMIERAYTVDLVDGVDAAITRSEAARLLGETAGLHPDATLTFVADFTDVVIGSGLAPHTDYTLILPNDQLFVTTDAAGEFSQWVPEVAGPPPATAVLVSAERVWRAPLGLDETAELVIEREGVACELVGSRLAGEEWDPSQPVLLRYPHPWGPLESQGWADDDGTLDVLVPVGTQTMWVFQARSGGLVVAAERATEICVDTTLPPTTTIPPTTTTTVPPTTVPPTTTTSTSVPPSTSTTVAAAAAPTVEELIDAALALIQQRLESGDFSWTAPDEAATADSFRVEVSTLLADINQTLASQLGSDSLARVEAMVAAGLSGSGFDVSPIGDGPVQEARSGSWAFDVVPIGTGEQSLTLTLSPVVSVDGRSATGRAVTTERIVLVAPPEVDVAGAAITQDDVAAVGSPTPTIDEAQPLEPAGVRAGGMGSPVVWIVLAVLFLALTLFLINNRQSDH